MVHSTDLSCRKVSFRVAPHGEIVIDIKKKIKRRHADIWVICFFWVTGRSDSTEPRIVCCFLET